MGAFEISIDIGRPRQEVFAILSDVGRMPLWYEAVDEVSPLTPGGVGVGSRYAVARTLPGGRVQNEVAITEYVAEQVFTMESVSGPTPFRYGYTLEPAGAGTRLQLHGNISGAGLRSPVARIDSLTTQLFKRGMGENLRRLKQLVEAS